LEIRNAGLYDAIWQAFAVLLPEYLRRHRFLPEQASPNIGDIGS
jgi:hypothetical protein